MKLRQNYKSKQWRIYKGRGGGEAAPTPQVGPIFLQLVAFFPYKTRAVHNVHLW